MAMAIATTAPTTMPIMAMLLAELSVLSLGVMMGIVVIVAVVLGERRMVEDGNGSEEVVEPRMAVVMLQVAVGDDIYLWFFRWGCCGRTYCYRDTFCGLEER
jgi:hypothetical protein